jgi:hypothetical protein
VADTAAGSPADAKRPAATAGPQAVAPSLSEKGREPMRVNVPSGQERSSSSANANASPVTSTVGQKHERKTSAAVDAKIIAKAVGNALVSLPCTAHASTYLPMLKLKRRVSSLPYTSTCLMLLWPFSCPIQSPPQVRAVLRKAGDGALSLTRNQIKDKIGAKLGADMTPWKLTIKEAIQEFVNATVK